MNILITAASTAQAYQLSRFLNTGKNIFFGDSADLPKIDVEGKSFIKIPASNSASFSHLLLAQCLDLNIKVVYPLKRFEILALAEARLLFDEYGVKVMVPDKLVAENLLLPNVEKGELVIKDLVGEIPDRGVFVINAETNMLKLFTAD
ncbi:MAG TPA: hypothetical protein VF602_11275 [Pedobacter sp.]